VKINESDDTVVFESTGKILYCHAGEIGLSPDCNSVTYGHDGGWDREELTKDEQIELADYMIKAWESFKAKCT
jgi:hypothetical protein